MDGLRQDLQGIDAAELERRAAIARWSDNSLLFIYGPVAANDSEARWPLWLRAAFLATLTLAAWFGLAHFFWAAREWVFG